MIRQFFRSKVRTREALPREMTEGEHRAILLSLAADNLELQTLRAQLDAPTFTGVRRLPADSGYFLLIYRDGDAPSSVRATVADFTIDDLFVTDSDGAVWAVRTHVHNGWLGPIDFVCEESRWPLQSVREHYYHEPGNTSHRDVVVPVSDEGLPDRPELREENGDPPAYWRMAGFDGEFKEARASEAALDDAERRLENELPEFLGQFLRWSNGGVINGINVLSTEELYLFDVATDDSACRMVIALEDGDAHVVAMSADESTVIEVWDHETGRVRAVYKNAREWAEYVVQP